MPSPPDGGCGGCLIEYTIKISADRVCTAQYCIVHLSQSPPVKQLNVCLQDSNKSTEQELYKRMMAFAKDDPDVVSRDLDVHLSKVLSEKYAFLGPSSVLDKWAAEHCEITVLPVKLTGLEYFSVFLPKDSVITGDVNDVYVLPASCISVFVYLSFCLLLSVCVFVIIIIIINLIYIAQFDTNGILTALYIVITYIQMQYVHLCTYAEQSYKYTYTCLHIHTYTVTCTNIHLPTY